MQNHSIKFSYETSVTAAVIKIGYIVQKKGKILLNRILLLIILLFCGKMYSQFTRLSLEEGLPQSTVFCVIQDRAGYIWCGTMDGLARYNGYQFKVYRKNPYDPHSLSSNFVTALLDGGDRLWIGTREGGLFALDYADDRIHPIHLETESGELVRNIVQIEQPDSARLLLNTGEVLLEYLPSPSLIHQLYRPETDHENIAFTCVGRNTILIADCAELKLLKLFQKDSTRLIDLHHFGEKQISCLTFLGGDSVLIGMNDGTAGIFSLSRNTFHRFTSVQGIFKAKGRILSGVKDRNGRIFVGSQNGLYVFDLSGKLKEAYFYDERKQNGISDNSILSLMISRDELLWIGTWKGGLNYYRLNSLLELDKTLAELTDGLIVLHAVQWGEHHYYLGTNGRGLVEVDTKKGKVFHYAVPSFDGEPHQNMVQCIYPIAPDMFLCGTWDQGLVMFNPAQRHFAPMTVPEGFPANIHTMEAAGDSLLLLGTDNGLWSYHLRKREFRFREIPECDMSGKNLNIWAILAEQNGNIWVGTFGQGLFVYFADKKCWKQFRNDPQNPHSLSDNDIWCMFRSKRGKIWIGTSFGLNGWDPSDSTFCHFFREDGLPHNTVYCIQEDQSGNLWISTNHGIARLEFFEDSVSIHRFFKENGLPGDEFVMGEAHSVQEGWLLFGSVKGLARFATAKTMGIPGRAEIVIDEMTIGRSDQKISPEIGETIRLKYNQNSFGISLILTDYFRPLRNEFSFYLENFDQKWTSFTNRNHVRYTNLHPGRYVLFARARNSSGVTQSDQKLVTLIITPPFWQRAWFRALVIISLIAIFWAAHQFRINNLRKLENLRIQIASDLHDEIGSTLTKIALYSDSLQTEKDFTTIRKTLARMGELSRQVIAELRDLVWAINARHDSWQDLKLKMQEFVFSPLTEGGIQVEFAFRVKNEKGVLTPLLRQNFYLIFKEAVHNLYKHSRATRAIIRLEETDDSIIMSIEDNGIGLGEKHQSGHGLTTMQDRAKKIHAQLLISSQKGTKITLIYPRSKTLWKRLFWPS